jgi:hypothetical protein
MGSMNETVTSAPKRATTVRAGGAGEHSYFWLDLARWLAALLVEGGHLRSFVFVDANSAGNVSVLWKPFYYLTGLGHEAVMVFFVLSGFLIGKHVYPRVPKNSADRSADRLCKSCNRHLLRPAYGRRSLWNDLDVWIRCFLG